jgi:pimeloyl-ACP methyl ester carboxylesterase
LYITADRFATLPEQKLRQFTEINFYTPVPVQEELIDYQLSYRAHCGHTEIFRARNEAFIRGAVNIILTDVRSYVPDIRAPTLIRWGRNDRLDDVKNAYWLYRRIPNAQLYLIERCGHQPHLEKPAIYDYAITRFLG